MGEYLQWIPNRVLALLCPNVIINNRWKPCSSDFVLRFEKRSALNPNLALSLKKDLATYTTAEMPLCSEVAFNKVVVLPFAENWLTNTQVRKDPFG
jgi:hypothetical protein